MSALTIAVASLALGTLVAGLAGAWFWLKSSRVQIDPWGGKMEPVDPYMAQMGWIVGILDASQKAAQMNSVAAIWTAAATILGVAATLLPIVWSQFGGG